MRDQAAFFCCYCYLLYLLSVNGSLLLLHGKDTALSKQRGQDRALGSSRIEVRPVRKNKKLNNLERFARFLVALSLKSIHIKFKSN